MNRFCNFSANVQNAFETEEKYMGFSALMKDTALGVFESGITKADADAKIREEFRLVLGLDENASVKEVRRAIKRHKHDVYELVEDFIEIMLTSGWTDNPFFNEYVDIRNLSLGDENEFVVEDEQAILSVGKMSGDHWDIDRQKVGSGVVYRVPTEWCGLGIYEEFEKVVTGRTDWAKFVNKIYEAMDHYVNELVYEATIGAAQKVLPGSSQFYKTAALDAAAKATFITMVEDVQAANAGSEVVIMGTKSALSKLSALADVDWLCHQDKDDRRNMGRLGVFEGTRLVEIPQVFKKGSTTEKLVDPNVLLIMPVNSDKFVKLVYEGNSELREITDNRVNHDMTYEFKYMTKLGVGTIVSSYFAQWKIVA